MNVQQELEDRSRMCKQPLESSNGKLDAEAFVLGRGKTWVRIGLLLLLLVTSLLVASGLYVRSVLSTTFRDADHIRNARAHVNDMLRHQLDEETGVRGYSATRLPLFLQSYYGGRAYLPLDFRRVLADLEASRVDDALPALRDAEAVNYRWVHEVAFPLIQSSARSVPLELRGKTLVDRFRVDAATIYTQLTRRTTLINTHANRALALVATFAATAISIVLLASLIFAVQQHRLGLRLEEQRAQGERERRKSAEIRFAYEAEKRLADTLQEALAQEDFPDLPTLSFSAIYVPASEEAKVGGDWYDAVQLPDGRVLLAIGDVTGHGIEAVVAMSRARQLLIRSALLDADPATILTRANVELIRRKSPFITATIAVVDTRSFAFTYAGAGHPPPVLFEPGRGARPLEFGSLPLAVLTATKYQTNHVQTVPGAMIVLYTDGVVEHSRDVTAGEALLCRAVETAANRPRGEAAEAIRESIFRSRPIADDIAILTIRFWDPSLSLSSLAETSFRECPQGAQG